MLIPKIIHYCWFGNNNKPKKVKKNIASWKFFFPNYKIIEWNENNTDLNENEYVQAAYRKRQWAFLSDFVRMKALQMYGGIYFDTDVEVLKPFPKEILELNAFTGFEDGSLLVSPGLVFASQPDNEIVARLVKSYKNDQFVVTRVSKMMTINKRITNLLKNDGLEQNDCLQVVDGITVFPSRVFCGYDTDKRRVRVYKETLSVHHYDASWFPWYMKLKLNLGTIRRRIMHRS